MERENEVEPSPESGRKGIARRRYELMKDDTTADSKMGGEGGFMSRSVNYFPLKQWFLYQLANIIIFDALARKSFLIFVLETSSGSDQSTSNLILIF